MGRLIDADALKELFREVIGHIAKKPEMNGNLEHMIRASAMVIQMIDDAPTVQPDTTTHDSIPAETGENDGDGTSGDCISRQQAIEALRAMQTYKMFAGDDMLLIDQAEAQTELMMLPSVQLNHNAEVSKMGIVHCEDCEHWDTSWETVYGLHYCPMIDMSTKKNFFCKYGAEKRGEIDETD